MRYQQTCVLRTFWHLPQMTRSVKSRSTESAGLRERKKLETRDALANAAMRLALERGLDRLRVEDIAAEANVSMRTFNNYFASKQEALAARYVDRMRHAATALRERPTDEPLWDAITAAMLAPWSDSERGNMAPTPSAAPDLRLIFGSAAMQAEILRESLSKDHPFALAVAERTRTDTQRDLYPSLVAAAVTAVAQVAVSAFLNASPPVPIVPLLRQALERLAAGLRDPSVAELPMSGRQK